MADGRRALGRGLSALIRDLPSSSGRDGALEVDLDLIEPNREQPRRDMDEQRLDALAASVKETGVLQPIVVRRREEGKYEIVAGERRWRAALRAGLLKVPVVVRDVPDEKRLELALIENVQRENLNPIEEARAYRRLADELGRTQEEIAQAVGKDRATVANYQRLLALPEDVQADIASGALSMGHARALAALPDAASPTQRRSGRARRRAVGAGHRGARQAIAGAAGPAETPADPGRAHARGRRDAARCAGVARGYRTPPARRGNSHRVQVGGRTATAVRASFDPLTGLSGLPRIGVEWYKFPFGSPRITSPYKCCVRRSAGRPQRGPLTNDGISRRR